MIEWTKFSTNHKHFPNLGSDSSSVWNFCAHFSDVILWGNQWWRRQMSAVFSSLWCACVKFASDLVVISSLFARRTEIRFFFYIWHVTCSRPIRKHVWPKRLWIFLLGGYFWWTANQYQVQHCRHCTWLYQKEERFQVDHIQWVWVPISGTWTFLFRFNVIFSYLLVLLFGVLWRRGGKIKGSL